MDSPQSVVSPFKSCVITEPDNQRTDFSIGNSGCARQSLERNGKEAVVCDADCTIGVLEIYMHQARDIHNICIYQKQDVYAKLCLTTDPENTVSTQIINGGGKNPVFNQQLRLNVRTVESSLKCELWMLSRVKNYLGDQLLGFALVPMSEILVGNGKVEKEFSLSSTDLFHSPAGFVHLSLSYTGASPEVMSIPAPPTAFATDSAVHDSEISESALSDFDKVEFPDPKIVNENQLMVSEYFGMPCNDMDIQNSESLVNTDAENNHYSKSGADIVDGVSIQAPNPDSPVSSVSTNGVHSPPVPARSQSSKAQEARKSDTEEHVSAPNQKIVDAEDGECASTGGIPSETLPKPIVSLKVEPEQNMDQQSIVDMYMKSMQQFTESLAKMKLPLDTESGPTSSGNSSTDETSKNSGTRVFYGSSAFF